LAIVFDFDENAGITELDKKDLNEKISRAESKINSHLQEFFSFLSKEEEKGNYVEIHWPLFEFDITIMMSKVKQKFLISVLNHNNTLVYGNLLLNDHPCIGINELKKFGDWTSYNEKKNLRIFKPL